MLMNVIEKCCKLYPAGDETTALFDRICNRDGYRVYDNGREAVWLISY